jgi:hypothetical protein
MMAGGDLDADPAPDGIYEEVEADVNAGINY